MAITVEELVVRLRLDQSDFTKGQQRIVAGAQRATRNIEQHYENLGIHSAAHMNLMREKIQRSYDAIAKHAHATKNDIIRAEKAKNAALKRLNDEQFAHQRTLFDRTKNAISLVMGHAISKFALMAYAVHKAVTTITAAIRSVFTTGFQAMADYEIAVASLAAMVLTFTKIPEGKSQADYWKDAYRYAEGMIPILENIAAKTLMTGEQVTALANAFARVGVFLNPANTRQITAFTALANALPVLTRGQEIMKQINTEIRALTQGTNMATSMLLTTLHAMDPQIRKHVLQWREQNAVLENIGELLKGFIPASVLLAEQWQAVRNALNTIWKQTLRAGMLGAYKDIIAATQKLTGFLKEHRDTIAGGLAVAWASVAGVVESVWGLFKGFGPILREVGQGGLFILKGWVYVFAAVTKVTTAIGKMISFMGNLAGAGKDLALALRAVYHREFDLADQLFQSAKAKSIQAGADVQSAVKGMATGWYDAFAEADERFKILEMDVEKAFTKIGAGALGGGGDSEAEKVIGKWYETLDTYRLTDTEKQVWKLTQDYKNYKKHVEDKVNLENWYIDQLMAIRAKGSQQTADLYKELFAGTFDQAFVDKAIAEYSNFLDSLEQEWQKKGLSKQESRTLRTVYEDQFTTSIYKPQRDAQEKTARDREKRLKLVDKELDTFFSSVEGLAKDKEKQVDIVTKDWFYELDQMYKNYPKQKEAWDEAAAETGKMQLETMDRLRRKNEEWVDGAGRGFRKYAEAAQYYMGEQAENAVLNSLKTMEDAFVQLAVTGKMSFSDMVNSMISDIVRLVVRAQITGPLAKAIGGSDLLGGIGGFFKGLFGGAKGQVFAGPGIGAYENQIVSKPSFFALAQGAGVIGEGGRAEGVLPLERTSSGDLGVQAVGMGGWAINIYEAPGTQATARVNEQNMSIDVMIEQVEGRMASRMRNNQGGFGSFMDSRYHRRN